MIVLLLFVQFATGILLAFHYVPATANAYTTVAFIELAVRDGAWIRSMHYHSSVLLPIALAAHILQMLLRLSFRTNASAWIFGVVLLGLVLGAAATGYALPWDARAINGVNIAISLAGNTPVAGGFLKSWMMNGTTISTLTLSRFYGLHVWIVPMLILTAAAMRVFIFGKRQGRRRRAVLRGMGPLAVYAKRSCDRHCISRDLAFFDRLPCTVRTAGRRISNLSSEARAAIFVVV